MSDASLLWRVPMKWYVVHTGGERTQFEVAQDGNTLLGSAHRDFTKSTDKVPGLVNGSVDGNQVYLVIYWANGLVENYLGTVDDRGLVSGTSLDQANSTVLTEWHGSPALTFWK